MYSTSRKHVAVLLVLVLTIGAGAGAAANRFTASRAAARLSPERLQQVAVEQSERTKRALGEYLKKPCPHIQRQDLSVDADPGNLYAPADQEHPDRKVHLVGLELEEIFAKFPNAGIMLPAALPPGTSCVSASLAGPPTRNLLVRLDIADDELGQIAVAAFPRSPTDPDDHYQRLANHIPELPEETAKDATIRRHSPTVWTIELPAKQKKILGGLRPLGTSACIEVQVNATLQTSDHELKRILESVPGVGNLTDGCTIES